MAMLCVVGKQCDERMILINFIATSTCIIYPTLKLEKKSSYSHAELSLMHMHAIYRNLFQVNSKTFVTLL